jgi:hypothetical protein
MPIAATLSRSLGATTLGKPYRAEGIAAAAINVEAERMKSLLELFITIYMYCVRSWNDQDNIENNCKKYKKKLLAAGF